MVCGLACQLEASKAVRSRVVLICCWSPESRESGGVMSPATSLPRVCSSLLLDPSQGATSKLRWDARAASKSPGTREGGRLVAEHPTLLWVLTSLALGTVPCISQAGNTTCKCGSHFHRPLAFSCRVLSCTSVFLQAGTQQPFRGLQPQHLRSPLAPIPWAQFSAIASPPLSLPLSLCKHLRWIINCSSSN